MAKATYKKLILARTDTDFRAATQIVDTPLEEPGDDDVLIKIKYAGINAFFDLVLCANKIPYADARPPLDMGIEGVGVVEQVGKSVVDLGPGDAVAVAKRGCGFREYYIAPAREVVKVKEATPEILTLIPTGVSAMVALEQVAELGHGQTVLVAAAAGGLGHIVVQLAKLAGNHVIGVCGSEEKAALLREIDCDRPINYRGEDVGQVLSREYPGGVDIAYESVGQHMFDLFVQHLGSHGRLIVSGYTTEFWQEFEAVTQPRIYSKLYWKAASIRAFMNPMFAEHAPDATRRLLNLFYWDRLRVFTDQKLFKGLESVAEANDYLISGKNLGKVVVEI